MSIGAHTFTVTANGTNAGTLTYGATTFTGSPTFDVGSRDVNFLILGAVGESGGSRGFMKSGVGTLRLTGASTYTGTTTISGGLLELTGAGSLPTAGAVVNDATLNVSGITAAGLTIGSLAGSGSVALGGKALTLGDGTNTTFSGGITGSGGAVVKQGAGRLTLSGSSSYDGTTTLQTGTLRATNAAAFGAGSLTLAGGRLELAADVSGTFGPGGGYAASVTGDATIASDRVASGTGVALALGSLSIGAHTLTVAAGDAVTSGVAGLSVDGSTTLTANATVAPGAGAELRLGAISGGFTLAKTGSGALTLTGGGHAGSFDIQAGRLNVNSGNALGDSSGSLTLATGVTLDNTSGSAVTISSAKPVSIGSSLAFLGSSSLSLGAGAVSLSGSTTIDVAAGTLTFAGDVTGAGAGIVKTGTGVLELSGLSGTNSFTGNSFVNEGELFISAGSVLGGGTSTTITVGENGLLRIGSSASQGQVTIASRAGGVITGTTITANFTFDTTSALTAGNANFNGVQTILSGVVLSSTSSSDWLGSIPGSPTAGRIVLQNDATLRATTGVTIDENKGILLESGTARFESTTAGQALVLASTISGSGAVLKTGSGGFRLTGTSNTYSGGTIVREGTFGIHADGSLGDVSGRLLLDGGTVNAAQDTSFVEIASARTVVVANGKTGGMDATPGGVLAYAGGITEDDPLGSAANMRFGSGARTGTVLLDGINTYRGTTLVQAGTLALGENASIAASPLVTVAANATFDVSARSGGFTLASGQTLGGLGTVVGSVTVGSDAFISPGGSTGTLTGGTYAFASGGTYRFEVNAAAGTAGSTTAGWDLLAVDSLAITATMENPFTIALVSLDAFQQPGLASFNSGLDYAWKFVTSAQEISDFEPSLFALNVSGFQNTYDGMFSVARGDTVGGTANELYVVYAAAVPEPATIVLAGMGLLGVVSMSRRRTRGARPPA